MREGGPDSISRRARHQVPYVLPEHESEADRLDVQHWALRTAVGTNFLAPVPEPDRILDVGSGTGQWAFDLCRQFPAALVVGFDLAPGKAGAPFNYRLVRGDLLVGLPFVDDSFDFVHQRLLLTAVPVPAWPGVVAELLRVTRPGGVVELVEVGARVEPGGPGTQRLWELANRLAAAAGLDSDGTVLASLGDYLRRAGAKDLGARDVGIPIGEWGGRIGSLMASDYRALHSRLAPLVESRLGVSAEEYRSLLRASLRECEQYHTCAVFAFRWGRKP